MTTLYLDACCLNRPFDDQTQTRVHLEAEAVLIILARIKGKVWDWVSSTPLDLEIDLIPDAERKARIKLLTAYADRQISVQDREEARARELTSLGLGAFDALHLACAASGHVDVFLTTDDRLLRQTSRLAGRLQMRVENPLSWLKEVDEK